MLMDTMSPQTRGSVDRNGEWTAMAIRLSDGTYARAPAADFRLRRLIQVAQDTVGRPFQDCRVLDLACLDGHCALELAVHGAEAVGIDARDEHRIKCNYAKEGLNLTRCSFVKDDVRTLSRERYGEFDIVICSGNLYHLKADDAVKFVHHIAEVTKIGGIVLIDTFVILSGRTTIKIGEREARGHPYFEHDDKADAATRTSRLWASIDNDTSFWLTESSLVNTLLAAGFTTIANVQCPTMPGNLHDRRTYLACRGTEVCLRTSDVTQTQPDYPQPESPNMHIDSFQHERSWLFKTAKRALSPTVKNSIKPLLRAVRLIEPEGTPEFMQKTGNRTPIA